MRSARAVATTVIGVLRAVIHLFMHEATSPHSPHAWLQASNIMIDRHVTARLADFGTSKVATIEELRKQSANIQGTAVRGGGMGVVRWQYRLVHHFPSTVVTYPHW